MCMTYDLALLSLHCLGRIGFNRLAKMVACFSTLFVSGVEPTPCPAGTVMLAVATTADIQTLRDECNCTGQGEFSVTWAKNLTIEQRIDVADHKNVTITGSGFPTLRGTLDHEKGAGTTVVNASATGMFSVSESSILRLNSLFLEGGNGQEGGAISVVSSSSLYVWGCTFVNNNASNGGKTASKKSKNMP